MADFQTLEKTTQPSRSTFGFGTAALMVAGATVMAAPPANESVTTSVRGQRDVSTYVEEFTIAVNFEDDLLAEGYRQFAADDLALAESRLIAATEALPPA